MSNNPRGAVRVCAGAVGVLCLVSFGWGIVLSMGGGFAVNVMGFAIRSRDPYRPLIAGLVAAVLFAVFSERELGWWGRLSTLGRSSHHWLAGLLAGATFATTLAYATTAVGAADSYGYVSQAEGWLHGALAIEQPWVSAVPWPFPNQTFTPLGYYSEALGRTPSDLIPTYPPGLPLLMAGAKVVGGQEALFWVVPIMTGLFVFATYGLGCRLASPTAGLIGSWLVATSPALLMMAMAPMSDVPAAAAWAAAFYFLFGPTRRSAALAGVAAAIAVAIRPNLVFGVPIMAAWYLRAMSGSDAVARRRTLGEGIVFCLGVAPGILFIAIFNAVMNGSPLRSGYGQIDAYFGVTHFWPNAWSYFTWLVESQTPLVLVGVAALLSPAPRIWSGARDRRAVSISAAFALAICVFYCFYLRFDVWWALRLLLPIWPFLLLGVGAVAVSATRDASATRQVVTAALLVFLGAHTLHIAADRESFRLWEGDRHYPSVGRLVRETTEPNSVILSVLHSGSTRYYGGRVTMRYDWVDPQWFDRAVEWLTARGVNPYLLVEEEELEGVRARFSGQRTLRRLDDPPVFLHTGQGPGTVALFDLADARDDVAAPPTIVRQTDTTRSQTPVTMEHLRIE